MIRAVGNKRLMLSNEEFDNYTRLIEIIDKNEFVGTFNTDKNGYITSIVIDPKNRVSMAVIMFLNQVMINQRFKIYLDQIIENKENIDKIYEILDKNNFINKEIK